MVLLLVCCYRADFGKRQARAQEFERAMGISQGSCAHVTTYMDCNGLLGGRPARYRCYETRCRWLGADE